MTLCDEEVLVAYKGGAIVTLVECQSKKKAQRKKLVAQKPCITVQRHALKRNDVLEAKGKHVLTD